MKHFLLFYEVGADYIEKRAQFREPHLQKAWESIARNEMILGGAGPSYDSCPKSLRP